MSDIRPVAYVVGRLLALLAALMLVPAVVDWYKASGNATAMTESAFVTAVAGIAISLATRNAVGRPLDVRQAYLLTAAIWFVVPAFGALPFWLGAPHLGASLAYFESVSGITTTGASVIAGLDDLPAGMNLWRGMLNWIGGLGIAFIAMIFLPFMRIGGMQFFRTEGFDTSGKALPRATDIAGQLLLVYAGLTVACIMVYSAVGMPPLGAVVNGMASIATGGFSPYSASFNAFRGAGEYAGALFMVLGSLPYIRYVQAVNGHIAPLWRDLQIRAYLRWLLAGTALVAGWEIVFAGRAVEPAFREALFNLASIMSSTGFSSGDFATWGGATLVVAFVLGVVGACSGSSAAGLSVFRVQLALRVLRNELRRIARPSAVDPVKYDGRPVSEDVIHALIMFITSYILLLGVMSVVLAHLGVDAVSALFAIWTTLGNIGYGYGPLFDQGGGTFAAFPVPAIWIMTLAMLLGRLGLLAILVLVLPAFWRK